MYIHIFPLVSLEKNGTETLNGSDSRLLVTFRDYSSLRFPPHITSHETDWITDHAQSFNVQLALPRFLPRALSDNNIISTEHLSIQARNNVNASKSKNIPKYRKTVRKGGTLNSVAAMMTRATPQKYIETYIYIYLLYICTCVKNGSKNSYRYGRSARIFTPPHSPLPLPPPPRRRGRSTREQLAKNGGLAWKVNERGVRVSSESPDDDINKSRGRIHRYIVRDEHGTRIIAQRSEDNGTHRSDANQHRTFYLPFHGSIPTHGYFARICIRASQRSIRDRIRNHRESDDCHVRFEQSDSKLFFLDFLA